MPKRGKRKPQLIAEVSPLQFRNFTVTERDEIVKALSTFESVARGLLVVSLCYARSQQVRDAVNAAMPVLYGGRELDAGAFVHAREETTG